MLLVQVRATPRRLGSLVQICQTDILPESEKKLESESDEEGQLKPFEEVVKDADKLEGLFTVYRQEKKNKIYLEIKP